jgi:hypothetical protein
MNDRNNDCLTSSMSIVNVDDVDDDEDVEDVDVAVAVAVDVDVDDDDDDRRMKEFVLLMNLPMMND